jgi:hypothetical protein
VEEVLERVICSILGRQAKSVAGEVAIDRSRSEAGHLSYYCLVNQPGTIAQTSPKPVVIAIDSFQVPI